MGGNSGGGFSTADFSALEQRILERLKDVAQSANRILFACEAEDFRALQSHMMRSGLQEGDKVAIAVGPDLGPYLSSVGSIQLLVTFSDGAGDTSFLDSLVEAAFAQKKQGIHAKAQPTARTPSKVLAYRWRVMSWDELTTLLD